MKAVFKAAIAGLAALAALTAHSDPAFPERPITLLCAFPAGASADAALRALAQAAGKILGQQVVVDNRPGAAGTLAATSLVSARADGYLIAQVTNTLVRQPYITKTNYDVTKDFSYIIGLSNFELGMAVNADSPWKTVEDVLAAAKTARINYATSGIGSAQHQVMERLAEARGIRWTHVPYKGTGQAVTDLLGKRIDVLSDASGWAPFVDAGKVRLLAVYGSQRLKRWPQVPTLKESGFDIAEALPFGIVAPAGVPADVARKLHDAFKKAMDDPQFIAVLDQWGQEPRYMSSQDYRKYMIGRMQIEKAVVDRYELKLQ